MYKADALSNVHVQCSQETAVLEAQLLGDIRAVAPATYAPHSFPEAADNLQDYGRLAAGRIPVSPLSKIDRDGKIAGYFNESIWTNASTSLGAVYVDGKLYLNPARTRHGIYPYPQEMRHGVFSVTKSMAGALAMLYFAERYGEQIFDELITDHVPAFANLPEWKGVTFSHTLNMATGVRAGEDLLYEPLELASTRKSPSTTSQGLATARGAGRDVQLRDHEYVRALLRASEFRGERQGKGYAIGKPVANTRGSP